VPALPPTAPLIAIVEDDDSLRPALVGAPAGPFSRDWLVPALAR